MTRPALLRRTGAVPLDRLALSAVLGASLAALAGAFTAQYGFDLQPCILCLYQRVPYAVAAALAAGALAWGNPRVSLWAVAACGVAFLVNAHVAAFHVGVEHHWWAGTDTCTGTLDAVSLDDLQAALARPAPVRCDQAAWSLFGITMAGYNVVVSLALAGACLTAARLLVRGGRGA